MRYSYRPKSCYQISETDAEGLKSGFSVWMACLVLGRVLVDSLSTGREVCGVVGLTEQSVHPQLLQLPEQLVQDLQSLGFRLADVLKG